MPSPDHLSPILTPHGHLGLTGTESGPALDGAVARRLEAAFARGAGHGLLQLGAGEVQTGLPAELAYWRSLGTRYVTALCAQAGAEAQPRTNLLAVPAPAAEELQSLVSAVPPMAGAEYLTPAVLEGLWSELGAAFTSQLGASGLELQGFLKRLHPAWNLVGRVHFNLAENRKSDDAPFAFMATYTTGLSAQGKAQHLPLGQALREYAGADSRERLLSLLLPVQRAAETCAWLKAMVDAGEIFHPLRWTPADAVQFLGDVPALEAAGVVVRVPASWRSQRPPRPKISATVGGKPPSNLGQDALLDFQMEVTLEGERLSPAELRDLLARTEGLAFIRGRWVQIDRDRLERTLARFREVERTASAQGLSFAEAMRLVAGADIGGDAGDGAVDVDWAQVSAGPWLAETLKGLRSPEGLARVDPGDRLKGTLRPYQQVGVRWLYLLAKLGLGACLADDMGLGKTIQVLSLLLVRKTEGQSRPQPSLLVAPASLLANWAAEISKFAPDLVVIVAHPSAMPAAALKALTAEDIAGSDLVITSYGSLTRVSALADTPWDLVVLDEAQVIKNPNARQTRAVKKLRARARFALTGTPIENRLGDLWSIFDFINPGLLGSPKEFTAYTKRLAARPENAYGPLRDLIRPYVLRRLKTDRSIISDLPEKTELRAFCQLTRAQAALYQQAVEDFARQLAQAEGIKRRGLVLTFLMRFKQICNHPSHWLGDGRWAEDASGKWERLRDIAEVIAAKQEKLLLFTQFREVTEPVAAFLATVFGRPGLVLSGDTEIKKRKTLVQRFQEDESLPFFVLSLKAGGAGLNLTAASHVVHFDRWWNPAVENQATDRAFRIGQQKNVLVHKFVCRGTIEEKIDELIETKRQLSQEMLEGGAEISLTELGDEELLRLVSLDIKAAIAEN